MADKLIPGVPSLDSALSTFKNLARTAVGKPAVPFNSPVKPVPRVTGVETPDPNSVYTPINTNVGPNQELIRGPDTPGSLGIGSARAPKYEVNKFRYPETLGNKTDQQHTVIFYINVRGASKWLKEEDSKLITAVGQNRIGRGTEAGVAAIGATGGAIAGTFAGKIINAVTGSKSTVATSIIDKASLIGGLSTVVGGAIGVTFANDVNKAFNIFKPDKTFRITDAIQLAVNKRPSVTYGVQYDGEDLGTLVGFGSGGSLTDMVNNNILDLNPDLGRAALLTAARVPGAIGNIFGANVDAASALQVGTATAPNPFREQVFRNVQTREFVFEYTFLPQSANEAKNVREIINTFKFHMHPEISKDGLFYVYPSTFDISYLFNGPKENPNLHKISTCVLENMEVDYGGQGWHTFSDGMPTEINMRLKFRELEVMTKERIKKGY
jgi:hypothetical protein